ncbi:MAG: hypothetical protein ABFD92_19455 [Planctomycetaceae bacterium]|nr:hypothetical protein [Planctomycetaceae bacterium]
MKDNTLLIGASLAIVATVAFGCGDKQHHSGSELVNLGLTGSAYVVQPFFTVSRTTILYAAIDEASGFPSTTWRIVDLRSQRQRSLSNKFPGVIYCALSPDGDFGVMEEAEKGLLVLNIGKMQATTIAGESTSAIWVGNKIMLVFYASGGKAPLGLKVSSLETLDPRGGVREKWKACGLPLVADREGHIVLMSVNPNSLYDPFDVGRSGAPIMCFNKHGHPIKDLGPFDGVIGIPAISPLGKWIALARLSSKGGNSILLVNVSKRTSVEIESAALPVAVTDDGTIVAMEPTSGDRAAPMAIRTIKAKMVRTISPGAYAAGISDERLYYVTGRGTSARLNSVALQAIEKGGV